MRKPIRFKCIWFKRKGREREVKMRLYTSAVRETDVRTTENAVANGMVEERETD